MGHFREREGRFEGSSPVLSWHPGCRHDVRSHLTLPLPWLQTPHYIPSNHKPNQTFSLKLLLVFSRRAEKSNQYRKPAPRSRSAL